MTDIVTETPIRYTGQNVTVSVAPGSFGQTDIIVAGPSRLDVMVEHHSPFGADPMDENNYNVFYEIDHNGRRIKGVRVAEDEFVADRICGIPDDDFARGNRCPEEIALELRERVGRNELRVQILEKEYPPKSLAMKLAREWHKVQEASYAVGPRVSRAALGGLPLRIRDEKSAAARALSAPHKPTEGALWEIIAGYLRKLQDEGEAAPEWADEYV